MKDIFFKDDDIKKVTAISVALLAVFVRIVLSYGQFATIYPPLAPIDDDLMFKAAQSIVNGNWLGEYTWLTISKHMFFAVWLAFVHKTGIPYLVVNIMLWISASYAFTKAITPALSKNWQKLFLFLFLVYNPAAFAKYTTRIYRDAIFPSLCLFFFAGIVGVGLRYKKNIKNWLVWLFMYGIAFGCIYLCREDGIWVIPFFAVAFIVITALLIAEKNKEIFKKAIAMMVPFALSALIISAYCYMNYTHYGRFIISDFTSEEFTSAYGALTSLRQDDWNPIVAIPEDVRKDVYREVSIFAPVEDAIKDPLILVGYFNSNIGDFQSGSFYWALRKALSNLGYYETPQKAQLYYEELTKEIQKAVDEGRLKTRNGSKHLRKSITPPIKPEYIPDVIQETFNGFKTVVLFEQCSPYAEKAVGYPEEIQRVENFIHNKGDTGYVEGTDISYMSPSRKLLHSIMEVIANIYKVLITVMMIITVLWQIKKLIFDLSVRKFDTDSMLNVIMLGLFGMALLRCAMIAFVEVSSFGIGTYIMYLSTVHPLIIAYSVIGFCKTFEF